ncbi:MAG: hypothetical protein AAFW46_11145, partial [Pseudomonadota bacterium]
MPDASTLRLFPEPGPRAFTIPAGTPFAQALAEGVLSRLRAAGAPAEALADVEIVVSTKRAARDLRSAFVAAGGGASVGPRLRTLDALGADPRLPCDAPPAIDGARRLLLLTRLVRALLKREPGLAATAVAPALAADLAALLGSAFNEGVSLDRLEEIATEDHAAHWAKSKAFLDIVRSAWPQILEAEGRIDPEDRNRRVVAALEELWDASPRRAPLIIAGSTGSRDTSARFIALAARQPQGAVVLPGFDTEMDPRTRETLSAGAAPEHPQALLMGLLDRIGVAAEAVRPWVEDARADGPARARLLGQALRPAPVTDAWRGAGTEIAEAAAIGCGRMTLIEAPGPREEAAAIALVLREALETPGRRAALITPDRTLARRVSAELTRWGVKADDSGGRPLSLTPPGVFFQLVAETVRSDWAPATLLSLLKHPLAHAGFDRGAHQRAVRLFEREALRAERRRAGVEGLLAAARGVDEAARRAPQAEREDSVERETPSEQEGAESGPTLGAWLAEVVARDPPQALQRLARLALEQLRLLR